MFQLTLKESKRFFFDQRSIENRIHKREHRAMSKIGAHIRRSARSSMRRRKAVSAPGSPPSAHSTDNVASLKNILFAYEPENHGVVVGPVRLNQVNLSEGRKSVTVPAIHEFGGTIYIQEERWKTKDGNAKWWRRDLRRNASANKEYRSRAATYPARPFMHPALVRERSSNKLIDAWREIL